MTACGECNRNQLALHTAQVEAEHAARVIAELQRKLDEALAEIKRLEKGKKR